MPEHPLSPVPVTLYLEVTDGVTFIYEFKGEEISDPETHEYIDAPVAVKVTC